MSKVRKGTSKNTKNENKRRKIFNKVLNMNWDYVRGKKKNRRKIKINKQKGNKQTKINNKKIQFFLYDSLVLYLTKTLVKSVIYLLFSYQTGYIM